MNLPTDYQNFIALSRYARYRDDLQRRETWKETVDRYISYMKNKVTLTNSEVVKLGRAIENLDVMPSMRALMTSGAALDKCNVVAYNCSYLPIDHPRAFDEVMYILMCGTGVGFSVEKESTDKLPSVNEHFEDSETTIVVEDSRSGWARGYRELIACLYAGQIPKIDVSKVRGSGERLKTMGGRSSGPAPYLDLCQFTVEVFQRAKGRKLTSLEVHDIVCKIGDIVVVGGVRRSALISLSDLDDRAMQSAKAGEWYLSQKQRSLANNSAVYHGKPPVGTFMEEWLSLYQSHSGERGIFNRKAAKDKVAENGRRNTDHSFGCNPCSEIILRPYQFCNLSEVVVRYDDTLETLKEKVRVATIFGTYQATLTDFKYLRKVWQNNCEEEALLGVSLTGLMDHYVLSKTEDAKRWLSEMKQVAIDTNKEWAEKLGINQATAITCVKPSGTVSQLVDSASGLHARHSEYYIRTVRGDNKDPMTQFMKEQGIPNEPDLIHSEDNTVFSFPSKSPKKAITRNEMTAIDQLEVWKMYAEHWCEHKPSATISVREDEWPSVGAWVWENFDICSGISFLPTDDHVYQQAPYQDCSKEEYDNHVALMPKSLDWGALAEFEKGVDNTSGARELACSAGSCEIVDIAS